MVSVWSSFVACVLVFNIIAWQQYWWTGVLLLIYTLFARRRLFQWKWKSRTNKLVSFFGLFICCAIGIRTIFLKVSPLPLQVATAKAQLFQSEIKAKWQKQLLIETPAYGKGFLFVPRATWNKLDVGDEIHFYGEWKKLATTNQKWFWWARSHKIKGVYRFSSHSQMQINKSKNLQHQIRTWLLQGAEKTKITKTWIKQLLFQESPRPSIKVPWSEKSQILGIAHFFVFSGFHLLVFTWPLQVLVRRTKQQKWKWCGYGIILLCSGWIVFLTGFKLTVVKAWCLILLRMKGKQQTTITNLSICLLGFLLYWPLIILQLGIQISFIASFVLVWKQRQNAKTQLKSDKITTFLLTNLLIIPLLITIHPGISLLIIFHHLLFLGWSLCFYPLFFTLIWWKNFDNLWNNVFQGTEQLLDWLWKHRMMVMIGKWPNWMNLGYYGSLLLFSQFLFAKRDLLLINLLLFSLFTLTLVNKTTQLTLKLHFLNVGHGQAILMQNPRHKLTILFDAGIGKEKVSYSRKIVRYLYRQQIKTLDAVFISHNDADHYNNLAFLAQRIKVKQILRFNHAQERYHLNDFKIVNLNFPYIHQHQKTNNRTLVLTMELAGNRILLPFDLEADGEKALLSTWNLPPVTIFQVGHHGSLTSSSAAFLAKIRPKHCFISNRIAISFKMKKRLDKWCKTLHSTRDGDIVIDFADGQPKIQSTLQTRWETGFFW